MGIAEESDFDSSQVQKILHSSAASISARSLTKPPIQWVPGAFSCSVRSVKLNTHLVPKVKNNEWSYTSVPHTAMLHVAQAQ